MDLTAVFYPERESRYFFTGIFCGLFYTSFGYRIQEWERWDQADKTKANVTEEQVRSKIVHCIFIKRHKENNVIYNINLGEISSITIKYEFSGSDIGKKQNVFDACVWLIKFGHFYKKIK